MKRRAAPIELTRCNAYEGGEAHLANYVHQRLIVADLVGNGRAWDFVVKLGNDVLAFNHELEVL